MQLVVDDGLIKVIRLDAKPLHYIVWLPLVDCLLMLTDRLESLP